MESCTALVEYLDGRLEIVAWTKKREFGPLYPELPVFAAEPAPEPVAARGLAPAES